MMTVDILIARLEEDLDNVNKKFEEYDRQAEEAMLNGDNNSAAYWDRQANEMWRKGTDIHKALLIIKERLGG